MAVKENTKFVPRKPSPEVSRRLFPRDDGRGPGLNPNRKTGQELAEALRRFGEADAPWWDTLKPKPKGM
jgi:hypothetical protein